VLGQTLENLRGVRIEQIVLVLGFAADRIARQVAADGVTVVINEQFREGIGGSLRTGLAALKPGINAALVFLADQPFVSLAVDLRNTPARNLYRKMGFEPVDRRELLLFTS
jgi:molybdenum cofactor cytidylyltransferase